MEKEFKVLRTIGTLWKILAWIVLIGGILSSIGVLLAGIFGGGVDLMRQFGQRPEVMPAALSAMSGVAGFIFGLIATLVYFLVLYAIGDLVYLLLAIEENTREAARWMQRQARSGTQAN